MSRCILNAEVTDSDVPHYHWKARPGPFPEEDRLPSLKPLEACQREGVWLMKLH